MRYLLIVIMFTALPAQAKWAFSADAGAAMVMPTGLAGQSETIGPNLGLNVGYQIRDFLRLDIGAVMGKQGSGADTRPGGLQGVRPAAKLFVFGGSIYGKASLPITLAGDQKLGLLIGGGYELKLLGLLGGFVEGGTGYQGSAGGVIPLEVRAGAVFVW